MVLRVDTIETVLKARVNEYIGDMEKAEKKFRPIFDSFLNALIEALSEVSVEDVSHAGVFTAEQENRLREIVKEERKNAVMVDYKIMIAIAGETFSKWVDKTRRYGS